MNDAIEAGARADLLPCPFCGGSDLVLDKNGYKTKWVICDGCGATIDDNPHGDCVDLWNRRAAIASGALVPASADNTTLATSATNRIAKVVSMSPETRDDVHGIIQETLAGLAPASGDYVVVPRILTDAMKETAAHIADGPWISAQEHWDAMLNAASRTGGGEVKLTAVQRDLLSRITDGWTLFHRPSDGHWWMQSQCVIRPHVGTIRVLLRRGYIAEVPAARRNHNEVWRITDAGRAALTEESGASTSGSEG